MGELVQVGPLTRPEPQDPCQCIEHRRRRVNVTPLLEEGVVGGRDCRELSYLLPAQTPSSASGPCWEPDIRRLQPLPTRTQEVGEFLGTAHSAGSTVTLRGGNWSVLILVPTVPVTAGYGYQSQPLVA